MTTVFYTFRDSQQRRRALGAELGSAERYVLYGLDQLAARGIAVRHNLERDAAPPRWAGLAGGAVKWSLERAGGYGGDFATVLAALPTANRADVVFSTVDTVGIPLMLLQRAGRLQRPLVYAAIGLPERLERLRSERMRRLYASALGGCATVIAYSAHEAEDLRAWLERYGFAPRIEFVPFGVDSGSFKPLPAAATVEVVSVGADPHRDYELLVRVATRMPDVAFRIVTSADHVRGLASKPENVALEADIPFEEMRRRLAEARLVALPVRENSYSGATTVLLQAMALGKPVVATRTNAIATGYGLVDGENCRLVAPGDDAGFARALADVLRDEWHARAMGASARATVERELTWERYVDRIEEVLRDVARAPATDTMNSARQPWVELRSVPRAARRASRELVRTARIEVDWAVSRRKRADLALFHEFAPPPSGGGHQFLRALTRELGARGLDVELNRLSAQTPACLFNSFNFDFARLRRFARSDAKMVHRVDGPIGVYRGFDDGTDRRIAEVNRDLADATVFQSRYSLEKHEELGFELRDPRVIPNAVDLAIFHPPEHREPLGGRKVRLVASSWSDNRRKGTETLQWLDRNLDLERYEMTFVGRPPVRFERIRAVGPVGSREVAELLRAHDVYVAPSRDDPSSNALLEALACGLPAAFLASGGHAELVGEGGLPFHADEELPDVLDRLVEESDLRREAISTPSISDVAERYLDVLGIAVRDH